jgi:hypothetical protein
MNFAGELMSNYKRLNELEEILDLLYEKLGDFQKELVTSASPGIQFELKQRIRKEILPSIRSYESEYWQTYPEEEIYFSEEESNSQLLKINSAIESISKLSSSELSSQMIYLLQDIQSKLAKEKTASGKLKVAIPLIPMIASYELEVATEGYMYRTWVALKKLLRR